MVEKLGLKMITYPTPYWVSWLPKGHWVLVNEQCQVEFQIGTYKDQVLCDVMCMDVCHVMLSRSWKFKIKVIYDGRENTFTFKKYGRRHTLLPLNDEKLEKQVRQRVMLVGGKQFLHRLKDTEVNFVVVGKPKVVLKNTRFDNLPIKVKDMLNEHVDIVVDDLPNELPLVRSINH